MLYHMQVTDFNKRARGQMHLSSGPGEFCSSPPSSSFLPNLDSIVSFYPRRTKEKTSRLIQGLSRSLTPWFPLKKLFHRNVSLPVNGKRERTQQRGNSFLCLPSKFKVPQSPQPSEGRGTYQQPSPPPKPSALPLNLK